MCRPWLEVVALDPLRSPAVKRAVARYLPLLGHVVPTLLVAYGIVIPRSCIAGWNELSFGFGLSVVGTCVAYVLGQRAVTGCSKGSCGRAPS